jgi:hypothetical protein
MDFDNYSSIPLGSLVTRSPEEEDVYIRLFQGLPDSMGKILKSQKTGAYSRGLTKSYGLVEEKSSMLSFIILQLAVGKKTLAQLPSLLSTELGLPNDKAQKMAEELEKDLLEPMMSEVGKGPEKEEGAVTAKPGADTSSLGVNNVLNLKDQKKAPSPPPMPGSSDK